MSGLADVIGSMGNHKEVAQGSGTRLTFGDTAMLHKRAPPSG